MGSSQVSNFGFYKPFATLWSATQRFLSWKMTSLENFDMYLLFWDLFHQYLLNIAKIAMGDSPKQG